MCGGGGMRGGFVHSLFNQGRLYMCSSYVYTGGDFQEASRAARLEQIFFWFQFYRM